MSDPIDAFRPRSDSKPPETTEEWMNELERLETMLEEMHEQGIEDRSELERRISEIEAALEAADDEPGE
ncbi:MAG TPA: hypothetical protein VGR22_02090 [Thermomicrobiales bacterium]|nr:hypothetical protein [Thermomicrobiales bacterium]